MKTQQFDYEEYYRILRANTNSFFNDYMNLTELTKQFYKMMKLLSNIDKIYSINNEVEQLYKIKISIEQSKKIVADFFESIGLKKQFNDILNGKDGLEVNIGIDKKGVDISYSYLQVPYETDEFFLNIRNHNSIESIFRIAHEFMHAITIEQRKFNQTTYTLSEVPSVLIEILLYDYMIENYQKYNLDKESLIDDIHINRFQRFLSYIDNNNRCFRYDYFIAILISNEFQKYNTKEKIKKLNELLKCLKQDNIMEVFDILDLELDKNKENKSAMYIDNMLEEFTRVFNQIIKQTKIKNI